MLKFMLENLEGLDEAKAALYTKSADGKFYLDVEGAVSKNKVDEFRNNNITLTQEMDKLKAKYKDLDPDKYEELLKLEADANKGKTVTIEEVDQMVADRVKQMQTDFDTEKATFTDQISTRDRQLEALVIDSNVRKAATTGKIS